MGLFKKIKDIFYDEEIVEVPLQSSKNEVSKPKIEEMVFPKKEIVNEINEEVRSAPVYTERELFKSEPTFNFPIFEDEEENKPLPTRSNTVELTRSTKNINTQTFKDASRNESRAFKPSPVISPIYGILDKNYKKDEIKERKEVSSHRPVSSVKEMSYDYVRRKAYGTLEDELEDTISSIKTEETVDNILEKVDELNKTSEGIENLLNEIEKNANVTIGQIEETIKDENEKIEDEMEVEVDNTLEHDLFNLIDSMYDDKEEE